MKYQLIVNSAHRDWQIKRGGSQWTLGKGFDGWAPIGPSIVSSSVLNPENLGIKTTVNGIEMQNSSTSDLIFSVRKIISFLSQGTTLLPGDVIFTGTYVILKLTCLVLVYGYLY